MMASAGLSRRLAGHRCSRIVQLALPLVVFLIGVVVYGTRPRRWSSSALAAALGYYLPDLWLGRADRDAPQRDPQRPARRHRPADRLHRGRARASTRRSAASPRSSASPIPRWPRELELIAAETRAGKPRIEAFKNFAERTKVDDVRSLVAMLVQTDRFGTSIGQALRTHADTSRTKRRQRAEEKAAKLGVKLLFPLVFCLFPAFYLVVLGPSMLRIFRQFVWGTLAR